MFSMLPVFLLADNGEITTLTPSNKDGTSADATSLQISPAADEFNFTHIGEFYDGRAKKMEIKDGIGFLANELGGVEIYDLTNPDNPQIINEWDVNMYVEDIALSGSNLYVSALENGLIVLDISNPLDILEIGSYYDTNSLDYTVQIDAEGDVVYIVYESTSIHILDVSDPSNIRKLGSISAGNHVREVKIENDLLCYTYGWEGKLKIVNVSNPSSPNRVYEFNLWDDSEYSEIADFEIYNDILYIIGDWGQIYLINASISGNFTEIDQYPFYEPLSKMVIHENLMFLLHANYYENPQIFVYNISTKNLFQYITQFDAHFAGYCYDFKYYSNVLISTHGAEGIFLYDVSELMNGTLVSHINEDLEFYRYVLDFPYCYVVTNNGLDVFDLSQPNAIHRIGTLSFQYYSTDVAKFDNFLYIGGWRDIKVVDISIPSAPELVYKYPISGDVNQIAYENDTLAFSSYDYDAELFRIYLFQVNEQGNLTEIASYEIDGYISNLELKGNLLFYNPEEAGLIIQDISDPEHPKIYKDFPTHRAELYEFSVELYENILYFHEGGSGLFVYDIRDLNEPQLLKTRSSSQMNTICLSGDYLFTGGYQKIEVFDVLNKSKVEYIGEMEMNHGITAMYLDSKILYTFSYENGINTYYLPDLEFDRELEAPPSPNPFDFIPGYPLGIMLLSGLGIIGVLLGKRKKF